MNPAHIEEDFSCGNQLQLIQQGLAHYFPKDPTMVTMIWTQHKIYMALDKKGLLFYNTDGKKKRSCDLDGPDHGCSGAEWWYVPAGLFVRHGTQQPERLRHEDPWPEGTGIGGRAALLSGGQCPVQQTWINASYISLQRGSACLERMCFKRL